MLEQAEAPVVIVLAEPSAPEGPEPIMFNPGENKAMLEAVALMAHEGVRAVMRMHNDYTSLHWEHLNSWTSSAELYASHMLLASAVKSGEVYHQAWCAWMASHGWKSGQVIDFLRKKHTLLVPFKELKVEAISQREIMAKLLTYAQGIYLSVNPPKPKEVAVP